MCMLFDNLSIHNQENTEESCNTGIANDGRAQPDLFRPDVAFDWCIPTPFNRPSPTASSTPSYTPEYPND